MIYLQSNDLNWNGLPLSQSYDDVIEHELNGIYKLTFKIPINESGQHKLIEKNNLIKASEHFRENGFNIFRVKYIDKEEDYVQYTAYQLLFDLSKKYINPLVVENTLPLDALRLWVQSFKTPPNLSVKYWSNVTNKQVRYQSFTKENDKDRYALNVLFEMAKQSNLDLDFNVDRISFGRLGTDTQFIYTTNKNITSFSQEENYDDIITRVTVTSKFKPDVDKEKIKQQQTNELNALKEQQQAYNKQIASEKRRQRMEREIESKIRKQELKKMNFEAQKHKKYKSMVREEFKSAEQIRQEIQAKYDNQQAKIEHEKLIAKQHADMQKAEIQKLKAKHKDDLSAINEDIILSVTVDSPFINDYPEIYEEIIENNELKTIEELTNYAEGYFSKQHVDFPKISIKVGLDVLQNEQVQLGDTVIVRYLTHDVDQRQRVIATKYSPLKKEFIEVTFGDKTESYVYQSNTVSSNTTQSILQNYKTSDDIEDVKNEMNYYYVELINKEKENFNNHLEYQTGLIRDDINTYKQTIDGRVNVMSANFDDQFNSLNSTLETNSNNTTLALNQLQQNVSTQFSQMQSTNNAKLLEVKSELLQYTNSNYNQANDRINQINQKVDDFKVGAVNLLKGTANYTTPFNHSIIENSGRIVDGYLYSSDFSSSAGRLWQTNQVVKLLPNTDYVLSYDAFSKSNIGTAYTPIEILSEDGRDLVPKQYLHTIDTYKHVTNTKQRMTFKFNTGNNIYFRFHFTSESINSVVYIGKIQLEKGTIATDWSPNIKDVEAEIKVVADSITTKALEAVRGDIQYLRTNILDTNTIEANMLKVDNAFVNKLLSNNILVNRLTANSILSNVIKTKSLESVYQNVGELRSRLITTNSISANAINVDSALIHKLVSDDQFVNILTARSAFVDWIKAIDIDAGRIRGGLIRSRNERMFWDLEHNNFDFYDGSVTNYYGSSRIVFHTTDNSIYQGYNGTCAFLNFTKSAGDNYPSVVMGTSGDLIASSTTGHFSGIKCHTAKADKVYNLSKVDVIADQVLFDSHGGSADTGGWTLENFRVPSVHSNVRAFYGNNPANYKYELGQREYKFRTL